MTKLEAYRADKYVFDPTYLNIQAHTSWTDEDWITYIDSYGYWTVQVE